MRLKASQEAQSFANGASTVPQMLLEYSAYETAAMKRQIIPIMMSPESVLVSLPTTIV